MAEMNVFEVKMKRLEEIATKMESKDLSIEDSLSLFKEGMDLGKECQNILQSIDVQVKKIIEETNSVDNSSNTDME